GGELTLREWLTESDRWLSPQAAILSPDATWEIARAIVAEPNDYRRTVAAGSTAVRVLKDAVQSGRLAVSGAERQWLEKADAALADLPADERDLLSEMTDTYGHLFRPASYGLAE
ncbi:MAG: hypothetical protein EHM71_10580, partial [Zetaproteobacteria bacterium]